MPYRITDGKKVQCTHCNQFMLSAAKKGRTICKHCHKPFIFNKELFLRKTREYAHKPDVYKRRKKWEHDNRKHLAEQALKRYYKKHDHIRKLNNLATARARGVSAIPIDGPCEICNLKKNKMSRHHLLPKYAGGKNTRQNLVRLCNKHHQQLEQKAKKELILAFPNEYFAIGQKILMEMKSNFRPT